MTSARAIFVAFTRAFILFLALYIFAAAYPAYSQASSPPGVVQKGAVTAGHCGSWAGPNALQDTGAPCGGSGSVPGGSTGNIQYNNSGVFGGSGANVDAAGDITIPSGKNFNNILFPAPSTAATISMTGGTSLGVTTSITLSGNGKTETFNNSLTFAGTDATTFTFPTASDIVLGANASQSITGAKTFGSSDLLLSGSTSGTSTLNAPATGGVVNTLPQAAGILPAISGTPSAGNCVQWASNQTLQDYGAACGGGGGGTPGGPNTSIQYNNAGGFAGLAAATMSSSGDITANTLTTSSTGNASVASSGGLRAGGAAQISWNARGILTSPAANQIQLGAADTSSCCTSITLQMQSATGPNVAGSNLFIQGGRGTGSAIGGNIRISVAPPGSSGSTQNNPNSGITLNGDTGHISVGGGGAGSITGCGSTLAQAGSNDVFFQVHTGATGGPFTSCIETFGIPYKNPPICIAQDTTTFANLTSITVTSTNITFNGSLGNQDNINVSCNGD